MRHRAAARGVDLRIRRESVQIPRQPVHARHAVYVGKGDELPACGLSPVRLHRLVRLGVIEPDATAVPRFSVTAAVRLRKILRLRADLGVNLAGAEIIVDLLARLDRLEEALARGRPIP